MLSTARALRSTTARLGSRLYSSASSVRSAQVLSPPSSSTSPPSSVSPPEAEQLAQQLKPQPFILRPRSRRLQLKQVSSPSSDPHSATLHFVSPHDPSTPRTLTLPNLFLRDASIHPDHVHPSSRQKLFRTTDVPLEGNLVGYGVHDVPGHGECLVTEWSTALKGEGIPVQTRKLSVVPVDFLAGILKGDAAHEEAEGTLPPPRPWDRAAIAAGLKRTPYEAFKADDGAMRETLEALTRDGIVLLTGVPTEEKEGQATELKRVVERIGTLKKTWYGDLWDVRAKENSENIAYTNLDLGLHMDLVHFDNPPRYQFLHSLQNKNVTGGLSYFVDTYALASHLHKHSPSTFQTLATEPVLFHYRQGSHHTRFLRPTFELEPGSTDTLRAVNYSPPFQGPLPLERIERGSSDADSTGDTPRLHALHSALAEFAALCDGTSPPGTSPAAGAREKWRWEHQLEPGECVVFDNRRVLHARTAFTFDEPKEGEGEGGRWLKGAYMEQSEVESRLRVLKAKAREGGEGKKGRTLFV